MCASFAGVQALANDKLTVEGDLEVEQQLIVVGDNGVVFKGDGPVGDTPGSGSIPDDSSDPRFMWYPAKAALRFGSPGSSDRWDDENIGLFSTAWGRLSSAFGVSSTAWGVGRAESDYATAWGAGRAESDYATAWTRGNAFGSESTAWGRASAIGQTSTAWGMMSYATGSFSSAWGSLTNAAGSLSTAWGASTDAIGDQSTAWGLLTSATGDVSTAWGLRTDAASYLSTAFGKYNIGGGDPDDWVSTDPLLEIGTGTDQYNLANALTVLKNGKVGIGEHQPEELFVVAGTSRFEDDMEVEGALTVTSTVRIPPSGDLPMGTFMAGDDPSQ